MGQPSPTPGPGIAGGLLAGAVGTLLVAGGGALLVHFEGDAVRFAAQIAARRAEVVAVKPDTPPGAPGTLVALTGPAANPEPLVDEEFGVRRSGLALERRMRVYQWEERVYEEQVKLSKKDRALAKNRGKTTTTGSRTIYAQVWAEQPIDSGPFRTSAGHQNTSTGPVESLRLVAAEARIGRYRILAHELEKLPAPIPAPLDSGDWAGLAPAVKARFKLEDGILYQGPDPKTPAIGDVKVEYFAVPAQTLSVLGTQYDGVLSGFHLGEGEPAFALEPGERSPAQLFDGLQRTETAVTAFARGFAWLLFFTGLALGSVPLGLLGGAIPLLGRWLARGPLAFGASAATAALLGLMAVVWIQASPAFAAGAGAACLAVLVLGLTGSDARVDGVSPGSGP